MKKSFIQAASFSIVCGLLLTQASIVGAETIQTAAQTVGGYDISKIKDTSANVTLDSFIAAAQSFSLPVLIVVIVLSGFMAIIGLIFKPLKTAAITMLGMGMIFYILVNYAPQVLGILIGLCDSLMDVLTSSAKE